MKGGKGGADLLFPEKWRKTKGLKSHATDFWRL
jgi:hypothetical protein